MMLPLALAAAGWLASLQNADAFSVMPSIVTTTFRPRAAKASAAVSLQLSRSSFQDENNCDTDATESVIRMDRRQLFVSTGAMLVAGLVVWTTVAPQDAMASGGATAGKYTTIPIAKRRYYGRVQQAVHEFLEMGPDVVKSDMTASSIQHFFDVQGTVIVPAKRKDIQGQCTKKDNDCRGREIRDSRYNDMKASMYLLANAFRTDQQKPPDRLPTVKAARAFFKEMDEMEKLVTKKNPKTKDPEAVARYAAALDILDTYLDLVELPPIDSGHYEQEFDTLVGESARIT